jgi:DNA-binding FadR family transcriptional regulator
LYHNIQKTGCQEKSALFLHFFAKNHQMFTTLLFFINGYTDVIMQEKPFVQSAAEQIIRYIIDKDVQPGSKLPTEYELAELLSVGRSTVREAVKSLASRNILEVRQGAGTFVVEQRLGVAADALGFTFIKNKTQLIRDLLEVRIMIEPRIAGMAARSVTEADIVCLQDLLDEMDILMETGQDHIRVDNEFHAIIAKSSGNIVVPNLLPIIQQAISLLFDTTDHQLRAEASKTHHLILDALKAHDPISASDAMVLHIVYTRNNFETQLMATADVMHPIPSLA